MEVTSFSLNPDGSMSFNFRETLNEGGNLDTQINIPQEDTWGILDSIGDPTKTLIALLTEIAITYKK
jgi:hypothetical protein